MNIFYLDQDPVKCASWHIDRHVLKMSIEAAIMLSTTLNELGIKTPYKPSWKNHPCRLWTKTRENFRYTLELGLAICHEYTYRYGKIHATQTKLEQIKEFVNEVPDGPLTKPALAMPSQFINDDPIESYKSYYRSKIYDKSGKRMDKWKKRNPPEWFYVERN